MGGGSTGGPFSESTNLWKFGASVLDQFQKPDENDSHWLTAVKLAEEIGYSVLNIAAVSKYNGSPLWARTTMSEAWAELYLRKDYFSVDPLIAHMKMSNEQIAFDCAGPAVPGLSPEITEFRKDAHELGYGRFRGFPFNWPTQTVYKIISFGLEAGDTRPETPEMISMARTLADILATRIEAPRSFISCGVVWPKKAMLTDRERELLYYLALGLKNDRIAERCGLAEVTVRKHLVSAREKLGASTREQALAIALQNGLINF